MDREYLEDYEQKERAEYEKFLKRIEEGSFFFEKDRYPANERFVNPHSPRTLAAGPFKTIWAQIPYCGSLFLIFSPVSKKLFEDIYFNVSEIDEIIDFVKKTGRLQIGINAMPTSFEKLDHFEPFFRELNPPVITTLPYSFYGDENEVRKIEDVFNTLARIRYLNYTKKQAQAWDSSAYSLACRMDLTTYLFLKLGRYTIIKDIENLLVDDPLKAFLLLGVCQKFIVNPFINITYDSFNFRLDEVASTQTLPLVYQPQDIRFPCEIGKFLLRKLTYIAQDMRACYDLIDHYDSYDLRRVAESLNEGIVTNNPDVVTRNVQEFSEILDNLWNDKTIPNRIKNIEIGVPVSIAAVGGIVAGLPGLFAGGFLSELGFRVLEKATEKYAEKLFSIKGEGLTERLAKLRMKSYQANIYDFKKKYKGKINE